MIRVEAGEFVLFAFWVFGILVSLVLGMRNVEGQKEQGGLPRSGRANGFLSNSFRAFSSYLRIVSSGASTVARSAASMATSIVEKDGDANCDQVTWAGFDKLEGEGSIIRQVLLLGYRSGFQVWDVEEANNVRDLVSRHDSPVSFMQMLPKPTASLRSGDKHAESRPLMILCVDSFSTGRNIQDGSATPCSSGMQNSPDSGNGGFVPTVVRFYSLQSQSYVDELKFRSAVYSVRCSSRVVVISLAAQIHCLNATTLQREYTLLTNPIVTGPPGCGGIGYGPLAVGPRWLAYSGSPIIVSDSGRVNPQLLTPSVSFPGFSSNASLVAHYAKESSKQLAAGIVNLGDMGYKKLSRYCSELLPDVSNHPQVGIPGWRANGSSNGHPTETDNTGMVIVRDIVSKDVLAQFRAHRSPISALCFDPSGTLLVTASVHGHNINVFKIMPHLSGHSAASTADASYTHLYRLQRGLTNAVIQDISFSDDSNWIMISSSRGTSHLFAINPAGGSVYFPSADTSFTTENSGLGVMNKQLGRYPPNSGLQMPNQQTISVDGPPVTLSVVSRIRNRNNGWRGTVSGAAAAATGRMGSLSGTIASTFHKCKANGLYVDNGSSKAKYHLLVFSPSGCMMQYALRVSSDPVTLTELNNAYESGQDVDARLVVEAIQKWNICQKQHRREREGNIDIYGDNGSADHAEGMKGSTLSPQVSRQSKQVKIGIEEKYKVYISEAELQMHEPQIPVWAKPKICFLSMASDGNKIDEHPSGGETEIERIPARMIEARTKDLVPVFDYLQSSKSSHIRAAASVGNSGRLPHQKSRLYENGRHLGRINYDYPARMTDNSAAVTDLQTDINEIGRASFGIAMDVGGTVNRRESPKTQTETQTQPEIVINSQSLKMEAPLEFVNNNTEGLKMENRFEDEGDEFD